jgi:hypothetical protein
MDSALIELDPVTPLALTIVMGPSGVVPPTAPVKVSEPAPTINVAPCTFAAVASRLDPNVIEVVLMKVGVAPNVTLPK